MKKNFREKLSNYNLKNTRGITLIALVITIIVLLILAGVSLSAVFSQDGIFSRAEQARTRHEIAQLKEALELAKNPVLIDGVGKIDKNQYFDEIQKQELINDKTKDVVDNEDGTYDVTTKPGHVFLIELLPTKENPRDIKVDYIGEVGKILPIIRKLEVSATSTSITGKATVSRLGNGTIKYYYKVATAGDNEYKEITNVNIETGATQSSNIVAGTKYIIKVVAKNNVGEVKLEKEITATKIFVSDISLNKSEEIVGKDQTVILTATVNPDDATNKNLKWTSSNTTIATVDDKGIVTGISAGTATITASATDGSEKEASCTITVKSVSLNKASITIDKRKTETLIATVLPVDTANKNVTWSSSNPEIATVENGVVKGIEVGNTTVTVSTTDNNKATAICEVTVIKPVTVADLIGKPADTKKRTVEDEYGNSVTIPAGFTIVPHGTTNVSYNYRDDHKPCVQDGIVIQDSEENQFVWIPIEEIFNKDGSTSTITLGRYDRFIADADGNYIPVQAAYTKEEPENYKKVITINNYYQELESSSTNTPARNLGDFVNKSKKSKGYYFGRNTASRGNDGKPKSKYNVDYWKKITQAQAATYARSMYSDESTGTSDLPNSYSWDTAVIFRDKYTINNITSFYAGKGHTEFTTEHCEGKSSNMGDHHVVTRLYSDDYNGSYGNRYRSDKFDTWGPNYDSSSFRVILYIN